MPVLSDRVGTFTDSVIRRMTRINNQYDSINLSQGFPDFDPPIPLAGKECARDCARRRVSERNRRRRLLARR